MQTTPGSPAMQKAFPLRVVVHDKSGKEEYRAEAFEVNWKKIDDSAFQLPSRDLPHEPRSGRFNAP
jgi:hypothetical protein